MSALPETGEAAALRYPYFPTRFQAVLFRNWGVVPIARLCAALGADEASLRASALQMGLDPSLDAPDLWDKRGYLTIIRNNWHLCPFEQLLTLLSLSEEKLAFLLKEDDFLWHKLGRVKPNCERAVYRALTEAEREQTEALARTVRAADLSRENAFDFLARYSGEAAPVPRAVRGDALRTVYSYFALYGDPLLDPSLDPFPDALLAEYARMGVRGVWLQGILYQLVEFPFEPSLSEGRETRMANLRALISRAARYGIGVYLYLNEPRSMPEAFFERHPELRGQREDDFYALCTSAQSVKDYLEQGAYQLFREAEGLSGFFTISMSENLTNCYSRARNNCQCPRCRARAPWEVVAEVNNLLARGARRADPRAKAVAWNWAWGDWGEKIASRLTEGQIVQCTREDGLKTEIRGVAGSVVDYTLSQTGVGERPEALWRAAKALGLETCAKLQVNNTWELAAVPYLPIFDQLAKILCALDERGVRHYQLSWTLGGCPSPMLRFACSDTRDPRAFLRELFGERLGEIAYDAQRAMSEAFACFPFDVGVAYAAPQNYGPMAPFFPEKTGWRATMVGFPYDDLETWRSIYPEEAFEASFEALVRRWREGAALLSGHEGESEAFDEMTRMALAAQSHFESTLHHIRFVRARERGDQRAMLAQILAERESVCRLIALRARDSRIGYEASNHYFYTANDLAEKLVNLDWAERTVKICLNPN